MLVLFTLLSVATLVFTLTALNRQMTGQLDEQLHESVARTLTSGGSVALGGDEDTTPGPRGPGNEGLIAFFPQQASTALPGAAGAATGVNGNRVSLTARQLQQLQKAGLGNRAMQLRMVDGLGAYRLIAAPARLRTFPVPTDGVLVVGLPTEPKERTLRAVALSALAILGAGVALAALIGTWLVRRSLEPLRRVADTATRVSKMPLHTGQVALPERVAPEYTDTRTEVGQVGAAFNEMLDHVDEALNARHRSEQRVRQFVADASHELRTPLASIKGYAELSKRESNPVPDTVTHAMGRIESEAGRMGSLVEDLLLLARLDAGRPLETASVDVSMLVVNAVSDAHAAAPSHEWKLDLPPEPVEVRGDSARLHQIVTNLLANARTHTPPGTRVTTSVPPEGEWVRIEVHDNGPGVPIDLQPNVFERFARGDNARSRAGGSTGLGLSIVAAVTRAHGGTVEMSSKPGDTTFALVLPTA
jgi:two-component system OmpR family sensor kinase